MATREQAEEYFKNGQTRELSVDELERISGGAGGSNLMGYTCECCGNFGVYEKTCESYLVGDIVVWHMIFECPVCNGYTFKTFPPKDENGNYIPY